MFLYNVFSLIFSESHNNQHRGLIKRPIYRNPTPPRMEHLFESWFEAVNIIKWSQCIDIQSRRWLNQFYHATTFMNTCNMICIYLRCNYSQKVDECPKHATVLSTLVFVVAHSYIIRKRIHSNFPPSPNWYWVLVICSTRICKPQQFECLRSPTRRFQSSRSVHF